LPQRRYRACYAIFWPPATPTLPLLLPTWVPVLVLYLTDTLRRLPRHAPARACKRFGYTLADVFSTHGSPHTHGRLEHSTTFATTHLLFHRYAAATSTAAPHQNTPWHLADRASSALPFTHPYYRHPAPGYRTATCYPPCPPAVHHLCHYTPANTAFGTYWITVYHTWFITPYLYLVTLGSPRRCLQRYRAAHRHAACPLPPLPHAQLRYTVARHRTLAFCGRTRAFAAVPHAFYRTARAHAAHAPPRNCRAGVTTRCLFINFTGYYHLVAGFTFTATLRHTPHYRNTLPPRCAIPAVLVCLPLRVTCGLPDRAS